MQEPPAPLEALTAAEVAARAKYTPRRVRELTRAGHFPAPLAQQLPSRSWRWSAADIDAYLRGEWIAEDGAA